jgi:hypothetical protein
MDIFDKIKFNFDKVGYIANLIKKWKPVDCENEKDFEKSLYNFLHKKLPDTQITKQYAKGRIKADLAVEDKIIIELKNNLDSRNKFQRLLGQLLEYKSWEGMIIILLTGNSDINFVKEIKKFIEKENDDLFVEKFILIEK